MQTDRSNDFFKDASPLPEGNQASGKPDMLSNTPSPVDWLTGVGEDWLRQGDTESARQAFHLALKIEPGNENATFNFIKTAHNWNVIRNLLQFMLMIHPENEQGKAWLAEAQKRLSNVSTVDEIVHTSNFLKSWAEKEQKYKENISFQNTPTITKIGQLMLDQGYLTQEQLENALNLQTMFERFGSKEPLGKVLVDNGYISQAQLDHISELQEQEYQENMW